VVAPASVIAVMGSENSLRMTMAEKIDKVEAEYRAYSHGKQECRGCSMFRQPDKCTLVTGKISPHGWCKYWEAKK